jgi:tetratricopeptide (TPR) repeat protein
MALHHKIGGVVKGACATAFSAGLLIVFQTKSDEAIANAVGYYERLRAAGVFGWLRTYQVPIIVGLAGLAAASLIWTIRSAAVSRRTPAQVQLKPTPQAAPNPAGIAVSGTGHTITFVYGERTDTATVAAHPDIGLPIAAPSHGRDAARDEDAIVWSGRSAISRPAPPDRCLGRDAEIAELVATLTAPRPGAVVVLGGPGIGKTTLTRAVATHPDLAARFAERRWFVPLETATDAASLRTAVVLALGGNPTDPAAFDHALEELGSAPALLVLDNLETPYDADTAATPGALRRLIGVSSVTLLCSYRGQTAPAAPDFSHQLVVPRLPLDAERCLFLKLARRIRPDDPYLAPLLHDLGGMPLAIQLVALLAAPHDTMAELWDDWQRQGVGLATDPNQPEGPLTSLPRSIDLSWRSTRLHDQGRRLFRLLGALPAGMAREDRASLLGNNAREAAGQLLAIGLALMADGRLNLLPPVRDYARRTHRPDGKDGARLANHYLILARDAAAGDLVEKGARALARLMPELANVEAALHMYDAGEWQIEPLAVFEALEALSELRGYILTSAAGPLATANALAKAYGQDPANFSLGKVFDRYLLPSAPLNQRKDDAKLQASQQLRLKLRNIALDEADRIARFGEIALHRSEFDDARGAVEQALPIYRLVGAVLGEANCIRSLGDIAREQGDAAAAIGHYETALALYARIPDPYDIGVMHFRLAELAGGAECAARGVDLDRPAGPRGAA